MRDLSARLREIVRQNPKPAPPLRELTYVPDLCDGRLGKRPRRGGTAGRQAAHRRRRAAAWCSIGAGTPTTGTGRSGSRRSCSTATPRSGSSTRAPRSIRSGLAGSCSSTSRRPVSAAAPESLPFSPAAAGSTTATSIVRQFFLVGPGGEPALLDAIDEIFRSASLLVTYNGRSFDVPTMDTRWAFHRTDTPTEGMAHFDMLPPARKLWGRREQETSPEVLSCSLSALERAVLGVHRLRDVPGLEIPSRYFRFLRSGNPSVIDGVIEHNRHDLLSLAALTAHALLAGARRARRVP